MSPCWVPSTVPGLEGTKGIKTEEVLYSEGCQSNERRETETEIKRDRERESATEERKQ